MVTVEFNPRDPSLLIGGLVSGQVCTWDIRRGDEAVQVSHPVVSHRYFIYLIGETGADCNKKVFTVFSRKCFPQSGNNLRDLLLTYVVN